MHECTRCKLYIRAFRIRMWKMKSKIWNCKVNAAKYLCYSAMDMESQMYKVVIALKWSNGYNIHIKVVHKQTMSRNSAQGCRKCKFRVWCPVGHGLKKRYRPGNTYFGAELYDKWPVQPPPGPPGPLPSRRSSRPPTARPPTNLPKHSKYQWGLILYFGWTSLQTRVVICYSINQNK